MLTICKPPSRRKSSLESPIILHCTVLRKFGGHSFFFRIAPLSTLFIRTMDERVQIWDGVYLPYSDILALACSSHCASVTALCIRQGQRRGEPTGLLDFSFSA